MKPIKTLIFSCLFTSAFYAYSQQKVKFILTNLPNVEGSAIGLRGSVHPLSWEYSMILSHAENGYQSTVEFPSGVAEVAFKFVIEKEDEIRWEGTENRTLKLNSNEDTILSAHNWEVEQIIDIATLGLLPSEKLIEDYALVEKMILEVHPGTYRYNSQKEIRDALDELKLKFRDPLTHAEAYLALSKLLATIQCDHTYASFFNQNKTIKSVIHRQKNKLPFTFRWIDHRMIVEHRATDMLSSGQEILSINSVPAAEIGKTLLPYVSADGATDKSRWSKLEVSGYDFRWSAFDVFYPLVFEIDQDQIDLKVFDFDSNVANTLQVPLMTLDERWETLVDAYPDFPTKRDDLLTFDIQDGIGILKLGSYASFGWKKLAKDYSLFFAQTFKKLNDQNIKHLIIDMRENTGGGDEMARELLTYFDIDRIVIDDRVGKTRFLRFPEELKQYSQTWGENPWYYEMKPESTEEDYYIFAEGAQMNLRNKKKKNYYRGDLYWLTSPANVSLAYYTAKNVRKYNLGPLIGEETGGNLKGINGGQILFLRLPNSQIEIDFPVMGDFSIYDQPNHGVKPDYLIKPNPSDIANGVDRQMKFAIDLISKME